LRLADKTFYSPDFAVLTKADGTLEMHEVKGFWQDDARVKIKVAASIYPFKFIAVKAQKRRRGLGAGGILMTCDRCEELDRLLGLDEEFPPSLGFTTTEQRILGMLSRRAICRAEAIFMAVWGGRPAADMPEQKIVDVFVCKIRKKLKPHGICVFTKYSEGYYLSQDGKKSLHALCEAA
jgi:hypothetical protein